MRQLIEKNIKDLIPYCNNSRTHSDEQVQQIASSIKEFGFTNPVLIDEQGGIIAGHGRVMAAKKLGLAEVPCIVLDGLSEAQKKAYIIADNKLALNAGWDDELLKIELEQLKELDFDLGLIGFSDDELALLMGGETTEGLVDEDQVPELVDDPVTVLGDVWLLGNHRLMCGDSTSIDAVETLMAGERADMCFTSPPYNLGNNAKLRGYNGDGKDSAYIEKSDHKTEQEYLDFLSAFTSTALTVCDTVFVNVQILAGNKFVLPLYWNLFATQLVDLFIWDKEHAQPSAAARVLNSVWEFIFIFSNEDRPTRSMKHGPNFRGTVDNIYRLNPVGKKDKLAKDHGAVFPVQFAEHFLSHFSDSVIYEPFGGSGTVMIASEKLGRKCFMMELDPPYCDVIIKRWQDFTGKQATLEPNGKTYNELLNDNQTKNTH